MVPFLGDMTQNASVCPWSYYDSSKETEFSKISTRSWSFGATTPPTSACLIEARPDWDSKSATYSFILLASILFFFDKFERWFLLILLCSRNLLEEWGCTSGGSRFWNIEEGSIFSFFFFLFSGLPGTIACSLLGFQSQNSGYAVTRLCTFYY